MIRNPDSTILERLASAHRVLCRKLVLDGLGHISVRQDGARESFLFMQGCDGRDTRRQAATVYAHDGSPMGPARAGTGSHPERFVHASIYEARPDVRAIVHARPQTAIALAASRTPLRPVMELAGFLGVGAAVLNALPTAQDGDAPARAHASGTSVAKALGASCCVLTRGVGITVVGVSLEQAVYRAIYAEMNARIQIQAHLMGSVDYLTLAEARAAEEANDLRLSVFWERWRNETGDVAETENERIAANLPEFMMYV